MPATDPAATPHAYVIGTEDAAPLKFWVAVDPDHYLQLDDVVALERHLPGVDDPIKIYGVVSNMRNRQDGARFDSDVMLANDGIITAPVSEAAEILTTRFEPETYVPPRPGTHVHIATGADRDAALFFDTFDDHDRLPAGLTRGGQPLYLDLSFIDGRRGGHINISGVSGVATKTTYAMFLLHSLFTSGQLPHAGKSKALVFNLKGQDLLYLDHANTHLDDTQAARYADLGLPATAFADVGLYAAPKQGANQPVPDCERQEGVKSYCWTIAQFCDQELLPYLFADADDDRQQYGLVVANVTARLKKHTTPLADGGVALDGTSFHHFNDLVDWLVDAVTDESDQTWRGPAIGVGTAGAFARRLIGTKKAGLSALIRGDIPNPDNHTIGFQDQTTVVDIAQLPDRAQRFVVGVLLRSAFETKTKLGTREPVLFVVLDELNKYAPRDGRSPIKDILLDIAERGRSLGIVLIGAQQTASEVERRIVGNSAIRVVGRLDTAEAGRPEYAWLPDAQRQRATIIKPGTMIAAQPRLPIPMPLEFPWPAWATRRDEANLADRDGTGDTAARDTAVDDVFAKAATAAGETYYDAQGNELPF